MCGTSPDCFWCRFEKQGQLLLIVSVFANVCRTSLVRMRGALDLPKRVLVLRTRRTRVILGTVATRTYSTPSVCLNKGATR